MPQISRRQRSAHLPQAGAARCRRAGARLGAPWTRHAPARAPNILVVLVDQLRTPVWMPAAALPAAVMPNLAALRAGAVSFDRHYTASNDCTPSRGALLTGLYSHQTGCLITGDSHLDPGFPTWGTLLRELGYSTWWWGKWHLNPNPDADARALRLLRRHLPLAQRRSGAGHRRRSGDRRPVRRMAAPRRGRGTVVRDGVVRQPPRHRLVVSLHRTDPLGELPARARRRRCPATSRRPKRSKRSASPSCSARCRTPPRARSAPSPSRGPEALALPGRG